MEMPAEMQPIITGDRGKVEDETKDELQRVLDEFNAGVQIVRVKLQKADPPREVVDAFNEVQRAKADMERFKNEAEAYRNDILPRAHGEASRIISEAEGYKSRVIDQAKGDTARFNAVLEEYLKDKEVVARRMYLEAMEDVYGHVDKVIVDKKAGGVVPYLPLPEFNKKKE